MLRDGDARVPSLEATMEGITALLPLGFTYCFGVWPSPPPKSSVILEKAGAKELDEGSIVRIVTIAF